MLVLTIQYITLAMSEQVRFVDSLCFNNFFQSYLGSHINVFNQQYLPKIFMFLLNALSISSVADFQNISNAEHTSTLNCIAYNYSNLSAYFKTITILPVGVSINECLSIFHTPKLMSISRAVRCNSYQSIQERL